MFDNKRNQKRHRAVVAAQVAILLPVLIGFAALAVDIGAMYNAHADLQRSADASARAAAAMLTEYGTPDAPLDPLVVAREEASQYAAQNPVLGQPMLLDDQDVLFGRATFDPAVNAYNFAAGAPMPNAVRVTVRMTEDSPNGPLSLFFSRLFGRNSTEIVARATALMVPRDIMIVADISGSTSWDSQLRHYDLPNTEINSFDVWAALPRERGNAGVGNGVDPPPPGNPSSENDHPSTGPGSPGNQGGNPNPGAEPFDGNGPHGPRWGWMTGYGGNLYGEPAYGPAGDVGLYYIPRSQTTTDPDVIENLTQAGYSPEERAALLSPAFDGSYSTYVNRVKVLLGLAGWRSKKDESKYNGGPGNGNDRVDGNELWQQVDYPFDSGSWSTYVDYVRRSSSPMNTSAANFKYQYGIKTVIDYMLVKNAANHQTPELADTPTQPLHAIKEAVGHMIEQIGAFETNDQVGLVVYATDARLEKELDLVYDDVNDVYNAAVAERLNEMQPAYYHSPIAWTNIGDGILKANQELMSERARVGARKVIILLTDGKANYYNDGFGNPVRDTNRPTYPTAKAYAETEAYNATNLGMQIYAVSVGGDADTNLMESIAAIGGGDWMHAAGSIDDYSAALDAIFRQLGGMAPVALID